MNFFSMIWEYLQILWTLLENWLESLLTLLGLLFSAQFVPSALATLVPGVIGSCVFAVTAVAIVKLLVGR